jgi:hypothetical protein
MSDLAAVGLGGLHTVEDVLTHPGAGLADGGLLLGVTGRALGGLGRLVGLG